MVAFVVLQILAAGVLVAVSTGPALGIAAAHGHGGAASALTGNDVSYPQCAPRSRPARHPPSPG
jgi:hypothetical protein